MDMKLDSRRIRSEREKRAWSQEHLAAASGLAPRTIQRVESSGAGSYETAKAIAAVLELGVAELRAPDAEPPPRKHRFRYFAAAAAVVMAIFGLFMHTAAAGQVALSIVLTLNDARPSQHRMTLADGANGEIRLERQLRLLVNPSVTAEGVLLSIQLYEFMDDKFALVGTPKLLAFDNKQVEVSLTSTKGDVFRIEILPRKI